MKIFLGLVFLLITTSSFAATFDGEFVQGSFILGKTEPGTGVFIDKKKSESYLRWLFRFWIRSR